MHLHLLDPMLVEIMPSVQELVQFFGHQHLCGKIVLSHQHSLVNLGFQILVVWGALRMRLVAVQLIESLL